MWYWYETHMHSREGSACGRSSAADMVRAYHAAGYAGAVLTDHFIFGNTAVPRGLPWEERMQRYYDAYLSAKPTADALDFDLLFGMEHFYEHWKEILIYGVDVAFWKANPDIPEISVEELGARIHAAGGFISHAHPYRFRSYMAAFYEPVVSMCDAIEVYNYSDPPEVNDKAAALAGRLGLLCTSGADAHTADYEGVGRAGLAFPRRLRTSGEFVAALRSGEGRLIINGEVQ